MATIKEVAAVSGVSTATVSHVLNGTRFVSEDVTQRVRKAMEELQYVPNLSAFSLRTQKTKTVSLLIPILVNETDCIYFSQIARGVEKVLRAKGYSTILGNTNDDTAREVEEIRNGKNRMVDGMIIAPTSEDQGVITKQDLKCPVVFIDRPPPGLKGQATVISDTFGGCKSAINGLIALGHREIGLVLNPMFNPDERHDAYRAALNEHDIAYDAALVRLGETSFEAGYKLTKDLLTKQPRITALFLATNLMAMGALQYLREKQIAIPKHLSVLVFDDYDWSLLHEPPITVIRQDAYGLGKKAAEIMLGLIAKPENEDLKSLQRLPMSLVERKSWATPRTNTP